MSVEFYLARRYLLDRRHGAWGWLISLIATGSVAIGVAALIVTLAVMTGFREDIRQKLLGVHPHLFISSFTGQLNPYDDKLKKTLDEEKTIQSWSPFVNGQILIGRGKNSSGATIKGIDPEKEIAVANIADKLVRGAWNELATESKKGKPKIILGQELARVIGARLGDVVWVITPSSIGISSLSVPKAHLFEVSGLINSGLYDYDSVLAYTTIPAAQNLFGMGTHVSGVGIRIKNPDDAESVSSDLRVAFEGAYWVRSWISQNKNLFSALKLERTVMFLIIGMLTVVASFMIVSNLLLTVTQKVKEIGILRAMGATEKTIRKTFFYQGMIMGLVGNGLGVLLGVSLSFILAKTNLIRLPADVYYIDQLPIRIVPLDVISVVALAFFIVLIATFFPSNKASKLDPLEAIRYG